MNLIFRVMNLPTSVVYQVKKFQPTLFQKVSFSHGHGEFDQTDKKSISQQINQPTNQSHVFQVEDPAPPNLWSKLLWVITYFP